MTDHIQKSQNLEFKLDETSIKMMESFGQIIFDLIINQNELEIKTKEILKNSLNLLIIFINKNITVWEQKKNEPECLNWIKLLNKILTKGIDNLNKRMTNHFMKLDYLIYIYEITIVSCYVCIKMLLSS
jgi:hypothetical protein